MLVLNIVQAVLYLIVRDRLVVSQYVLTSLFSSQL